jgi:hypothetical protein
MRITDTFNAPTTFGPAQAVPAPVVVFPGLVPDGGFPR